MHQNCKQLKPIALRLIDCTGTGAHHERSMDVNNPKTSWKTHAKKWDKKRARRTAKKLIKQALVMHDADEHDDVENWPIWVSTYEQYVDYLAEEYREQYMDTLMWERDADYFDELMHQREEYVTATMQSYCMNCGEYCASDWNFCPECGTARPHIARYVM